MTFLAPAWIGVAALASLGVVAIHLIAWRLPRTVVLPTARFVPDEPARRATRTLRVADVGLLALRVALVMTGGVAMAQPVVASRRGGSATVIAVASSIGDSVALSDSLRTIRRGDHTSFIVFDTSTRVASESELRVRSGTRVESSLSSGLLAAIREARRLQQRYESVAVVVVDPFMRSSFDQATAGIRSMWADSIRLVRVPNAAQAVAPAQVEMIASGDDPIVAGIRLAQANGLIHGHSRVVREGRSGAPDSGQALILWSRATPNESARVGAVHAGGVTAIGQFIPTTLADSGRVIARWANGAPAATEFTARDDACVRTVGFDVPDLGDFALAPSFQHLAAELLAPCGSAPLAAPAVDSLLASVSAPQARAPVSTLPRDDSPNKTAAFIMGIAVLLGAAELLVRRRWTPVLAGGGA